MKKFSAEKRAKIAAALRLNRNAAAVAKQIGGVSPETVRAVAKEAPQRIVHLGSANQSFRHQLAAVSSVCLRSALNVWMGTEFTGGSDNEKTATWALDALPTPLSCAC